jgi:hypothetical protein
MKLDVIADKTDAPWYAEGLSFTCTQCGNCCTGGPGYVWISDQEVERLAGHLRMSVEAVVRQYTRKIGGRLSLKEQRTPQGNYDCVFLKEIPAEFSGQPPGTAKISQSRRVCTIYSDRPLQCRTWPFWDGNLQSPSAWVKAGRHCPGIDRGTSYSREQIESLRDAREWPE